MIWNDLAARALNDAEILMWNHIVHSWVDPVALFAVFCAALGASVWITRWLFRL